VSASGSGRAQKGDGESSAVVSSGEGMTKVPRHQAKTAMPVNQRLGNLNSSRSEREPKESP